MSSHPTYKSYVEDEEFLENYNDYQKKYAERIRESDRIILGLVNDRLNTHAADGAPLRLLDIGCSTGNLLLHLKRAFGDRLQLTGGDLAQSSLEECRRNPALAGIAFETMDMLDLPQAAYDIVVVNAVLYMMDDANFTRALSSLAGALTPGGLQIVFDFFHPFPQDLTIIEKSASHPDGLALHFRRQDVVVSMLDTAGFGEAVFRPFTLPIDLPCQPDHPDLVTYTLPAADGRRLPFRGSLFQPWCHMTAVRQ